jgi:hypothetical protein
MLADCVGECLGALYVRRLYTLGFWCTAGLEIVGENFSALLARSFYR